MEWVSLTGVMLLTDTCGSVYRGFVGSRRGPGPNPQTSLCRHPPTSYLPNPPATNPKTHWTWGPLIIFTRWRFYKLMFYFILKIFFLLGKHYKHYTKRKMGMSHCRILDMATHQCNVIPCCFCCAPMYSDIFWWPSSSWRPQASAWFANPIAQPWLHKPSATITKS